MKINKSLLQAMLVGVTLGTTVTSCTTFDAIVDDIDEITEDRETRTDDGTIVCWTDCPACGMG